jgi:hypothetical protein
MTGKADCRDREPTRVDPAKSLASNFQKSNRLCTAESDPLGGALQIFNLDCFAAVNPNLPPTTSEPVPS